MAITPVPRDVNYTGRKTNRNRKGQVVKEVWVDESHTQEGDFRKMIQLIKWEDGGLDVRFSYYVKDSNQDESEWRYGSQTTFTLPLKLAQELIEKAQKAEIL